MRRNTRCFFSLALLFILGSILPTKLNASDQLPPDCCKFFSEADFNPLKFDYSSRSGGLSSTSSKLAKKSKTPVRGLAISESSLKWSFNYPPTKPTAPKTVSVIALRKHGHICFRLSPVNSEPVRKKRTAPTLIWPTGSLANLSILMRLFANEASSSIYNWMVPPEQLPVRVLRIVSDLISIR